MGQASSKRRSFSPGSAEKAAEAVANGEVKAAAGRLVNGEIEQKESGGIEEVDEITATTPTSATSDTTGRKETKRKRFRVSGLFSLKRTPSGRWPRRRKADKTSTNGSRPSSCPDPLNEEGSGVMSPARPQSLFLDELDITEDESKIETVDLSDQETDSKQKQKSTPAPKPPEKTKGRRGSKKQSSLKKKNKEKKKDKKSKKLKAASAAVDTASDAVTEKAIGVATNLGVDKSIVESTVDKAADIAKESATSVASGGSGSEVVSESPKVPETTNKPSSEPGESTEEPELIPCLSSREERGSVGDSVMGFAQQIFAQIDSKAHLNEKIEAESEKQDTEGDEKLKEKGESGEDGKKKDQEEDLDFMASSIVAETMDIAQKRLGECKEQVDDDKEDENKHDEDTHANDNTSLLDQAEELTGGLPKEEVVEESVVSALANVEASAPIEVNTITPQSPTRSPKTRPAPQAPPRSKNALSQSIEVEVAPQAPLEFPAGNETEKDPSFKDTIIDKVKDADIEVVSSAAEQVGPKADSLFSTITTKAEDIVGESVVEKAEEKIHGLLQSTPLKSDVSSDATELPKSDEAKPVEVKDANEPKELEKPNVTNADDEDGVIVAAAAAAVASVENIVEADDQANTSMPTKTDIAKDKEVKTKEEIKRLKKEKEAKEKQRQKEEKKRKSEQKSAEKDKTKGEKKMKVPKRLSSLFNWKEKKIRTSSSDTPSTPEIACDENTPQLASSLETTSEVFQETEAPVPAENQIPKLAISEADPNPTEPQNTSLSIDVSVEPLVKSAVSKAVELGNSELGAAAVETAEAAAGEIIPLSSSEQSPVESPPTSPVKSSEPSDLSEPTSPGSDSETNGSSGGLKKISLGPRLRTAILRKRSSGAGDNAPIDRAERTVSLTTPKTVLEAGEDVTPPPRKLRPRKPVEQYSPVTSGAHNPTTSFSSSMVDNVQDKLTAAENRNISSGDSSLVGDTIEKTVEHATDAVADKLDSCDEQKSKAENVLETVDIKAEVSDHCLSQKASKVSSEISDIIETKDNSDHVDNSEHKEDSESVSLNPSVLINSVNNDGIIVESVEDVIVKSDASNSVNNKLDPLLDKLHNKDKESSVVRDEESIIEKTTVNETNAAVSLSVNSIQSPTDTPSDTVDINAGDTSTVESTEAVISELTNFSPSLLESARAEILSKLSDETKDTLPVEEAEITSSSREQVSCDSTATTDSPAHVEEEMIVPTKRENVQYKFPIAWGKIDEKVRAVSAFLDAASDTDDTDPTQKTEEKQQDDEGETFTSLPSPTVVSTASITLRPPSVDDTCPDANEAASSSSSPSAEEVSKVSISDSVSSALHKAEDLATSSKVSSYVPSEVTSSIAKLTSVADSDTLKDVETSLPDLQNGIQKIIGSHSADKEEDQNGKAAGVDEGIDDSENGSNSQKDLFLSKGITIVSELPVESLKKPTTELFSKITDKGDKEKNESEADGSSESPSETVNGLSSESQSDINIKKEVEALDSLVRNDDDDDDDEMKYTDGENNNQNELNRSESDDTIEAYLKLQAPSLETAFINGQKGLEENGNILLTSTLGSDLCTKRDEQDVTG